MSVDIVAEQAYEIKRLKMENELLRDFLRGEGVVYLSMIRDLYDNSIVAYKTATRQTVNLVLDTIRLAVKKKKWSLGDHSSTATKGPSTLRKHTLT